MAKKAIVIVLDVDITPEVVGSDPEVPGSGTNATLDYIIDKIIVDGCAARGLSGENKTDIIHTTGRLPHLVYEVMQ